MGAGAAPAPNQRTIARKNASNSQWSSLLPCLLPEHAWVEAGRSSLHQDGGQAFLRSAEIFLAILVAMTCALHTSRLRIVERKINTVRSCVWRLPNWRL